jgi:hypothetical protein
LEAPLMPLTLEPLIEDYAADWLCAAGFGTKGTDFFQETLPECPPGPATATALRDLGGPASEPYHGGITREVSWQFLHRSATYRDGKKFLNALEQFFRDNRNDIDLPTSGTALFRVLLFQPLQQSPVVADIENGNRYIWTFSVALTYHRLNIS